MQRFPCPYLGAEVELTDERSVHITRHHPELLPEHLEALSRTLADPDEMRRDERFPGTRAFSRWFDDVKGGKHVVVMVVSDAAPVRHWVVTAFIARRLSAKGEVEWTRS